jgi:hypothetical protein
MSRCNAGRPDRFQNSEHAHLYIAFRMRDARMHADRQRGVRADARAKTRHMIAYLARVMTHATPEQRRAAVLDGIGLLVDAAYGYD